MHKSAIVYAIGKIMQVMGLVLLVPLGLSVYDYRSLGIVKTIYKPEVFGFLLVIILCLGVGSILVYAFRQGRYLQGIKEGYAIVTLGWLSMAFWFAIPLCFYLMSLPGSDFRNLFGAFTDAYFEVMSGFTTTGATIFGDVESLPRSLLFLRALAHWLGGMGIITLAIVIFPSLGVSGYQMFRGEVPGPSKDKLRPRLAQTVSILWGVYVLFTAAETVLLMAGGMDLFEAVCHSFATMATGGFSTHNTSVAGQNDFIQWVIIVFMYLAGVNFILHYRALRGDVKNLFANREFRFYNGVIIVAVFITVGVLYFNGLAAPDVAESHFRSVPMSTENFAEHYGQQAAEVENFYGAVKVAFFQVVSIVTTTGLATADFDLWPNFLRFMLVFLMFFGGCAGSTGGGMKMVRIMIVFKVAINILRKLTQPKLVAPIKLGDQVVDDDRIINIVSFFILFTGLFVLTAILMTLFVPDLVTALACSIATIGNIGPGLAGVGAIENYGWIPLPGKWLLVMSMLLGRLEIFTVLIVFRPSVWRK